MATTHPSQSPFLLQTIVRARFASFTPQRIYGYASSQELANRTKSLAQTPHPAKTVGTGFFNIFLSKTVPNRYNFSQKTAENSLSATVLTMNEEFGLSSTHDSFRIQKGF